MINRFGPPFARGPQFVYGDSYGGVAQNELAQDASRDSRYYQGLGAQRANRALDFQDQQAEAGNQLQWQQLIQQAAEAARRNQIGQDEEAFRREQLGQNNAQFAADLALRKAGQESTDAYHRGVLDINRAKEAAFDTPEAKSAPLFAEGMQLAQGGYGDRSNLDLASLYPGLSPNQLARIQAVINSRRATLSEGDTAGENQAKILNDQLLNLKRSNLIAKLRADASSSQQGINLPRWMGGSGLDSTIAGELAQQELKANAGQMDASLAPVPATDPNLQKFITTLGKNPKMANIVQYDEQSQRVLPVRRSLTLPPPPAGTNSITNAVPPVVPAPATNAVNTATNTIIPRAVNPVLSVTSTETNSPAVEAIKAAVAAGTLSRDDARAQLRAILTGSNAAPPAAVAPASFTPSWTDAPGFIRDAPAYPFLSPSTNAALAEFSRIQDEPPSGFIPVSEGVSAGASALLQQNATSGQKVADSKDALIKEMADLMAEQSKPIPRVQLSEQEAEQLRQELQQLEAEARRRGIKIE